MPLSNLKRLNKNTQFFAKWFSSFSLFSVPHFNSFSSMPTRRLLASSISRQLTKIPSRSIVSIHDLKNTYNILLEQKQLSPLQGAILDFSGTVERMYDFAKQFPEHSHTTDLVNALFHKQGDQFKQTVSQSNPAYSLTPLVLAHIMQHLASGTINTAKSGIIKLWKEQYKKLTDSTISTKKINEVLDKISGSQQEGIENKYPPHTTESILLSFLYHKAKSRQDVVDYLSVLNSLKPVTDNTKKLISNDEFTEEEVKQGKNLMANSDLNNQSVHNHYEILMSSMMLMGNRLPQVKQARYAYKDNIVTVANCVETGFHNLCNILVYDDKKAQFDLKQLPKTLHPHEKLVAIYELQNFKTSKVNSSEVGQAFMDLVSGLSTVKYKGGKDYELPGYAPENFVPVMNHLFGTKATSLAELSKEFSDARRSIIFREKNSRIEILIERYEDEKTEFLNFLFSYGHGELQAARFYMHDTEKMKEVGQLSKIACSETKKYPLLISALNNMGLDMKENFSGSPDFRQMFFHLFPKNNDEAIHVINHLLPKLEKDHTIKNYILTLCDKFNISEKDSVLSCFIKNKLDVSDKKVFEYCHLNFLDYIKLKFPCDIRNNSEKKVEIENEEKIIINLLKQFDDNTQILRNGLIHHLIDDANIKLLIQAGADPDVDDLSGRSLLHLRSDTELLQCLLSAKADINKKDYDVNTPLHAAAMRNDAKAIQFLLNAGADLFIINGSRNIPLECATKPECVKLLLDAVIQANPDYLETLIHDGENQSALVEGLRILQRATLTPQEKNHFIMQLFSCASNDKFNEFNFGLRWLEGDNLLNNEFIAILMKNFEHAHELACGFSFLKDIDMLDKYRDVLMAHPEHASDLGKAFKKLKNHDLLIDENVNQVMQDPIHYIDIVDSIIEKNNMEVRRYSL